MQLIFKHFHIHFKSSAFKAIVLTFCLLGISGCTAALETAPHQIFGPIKKNLDSEEKCELKRRSGDFSRPERGIVEGNSSFIDPSWELYVIDLDIKRLSKVESVWSFEDGKMVIKQSRTTTIGLTQNEIRDIVAIANSIWSAPTDIPSHAATDTAWTIELMDGQAMKCQSKLGEPSGDGGLLTKTIYEIWTSRRSLQK